ncbi:MAG: helix-turn-helix transcriptional regulator [Gemmatimonadetes bacterium]|nr:helix-turn-helix transcriptional regulator [Gemmatimonadota bacterium]NNL30287.1 helix-turn-helix transcriptional regulator [Gemmatimonadota bacterium]
MIVVQASENRLRRAVLRAAHPEEDVVMDPRLVADALEKGFPRLVVRDAVRDWPVIPDDVRVLEVGPAVLERWEADRKAVELPPTRLDHLTDRIASSIERSATDRTWVDTALAELSRAAGRRLPPALRSFGRRVMEFPSHYTTLRPLADTCSTSRGALKALFRRRDLSTPSTYLRWFRLMAVGRVLADREVTVAETASRLGFTSDGNLCRMMWGVCEMTPTELRSLRGWNRLLITFAWSHLSPDHLEAWSTLDDLFEQRSA